MDCSREIRTRKTKQKEKMSCGVVLNVRLTLARWNGPGFGWGRFVFRGATVRPLPGSRRRSRWPRLGVCMGKMGKAP